MLRAALATLITVSLHALSPWTAAAAALVTPRQVTAGASQCVMAIALRDFVPAEQRIASQQFTAPLLRGYGAADARYLTATADDDGRVLMGEALRAAKDRGCAVDLWLMDNSGAYVSWLESLPREQRPVLRLVYDTGAGGGAYAARWLHVGARTVVAHSGGGNLAPVFYVLFLPRFMHGLSVADAVDDANRETSAVVHGVAKVIGSVADVNEGELWSNTEARVFGDADLVR